MDPFFPREGDKGVLQSQGVGGNQTWLGVEEQGEKSSDLQGEKKEDLG